MIVNSTDISQKNRAVYSLNGSLFAVKHWFETKLMTVHQMVSTIISKFFYSAHLLREYALLNNINKKPKNTRKRRQIV